MLSKLTFLVLKVLSFIPTKLPTGVTDFSKWMDDICTLAGPLADRRSMEFVISSNLLHLDERRTGFVPKHYFVTRLIKAAATQCAHYRFQEIKVAQAEEAQKKQAEAMATAQKLAEVTAPTEGTVTNGAKEIVN